jgi:Zn-dependent protease with chaperone function
VDTYTLLGISVALAFLLVVHLSAAVLTSAIWAAISSRVRCLSPRVQARIIFGLRITPVVAALLFVLAFVVPAYLIHEPYQSGEGIGLKLGIVAIVSSAGVAIALVHLLRTWMVTRRLTLNWLSAADRIDVRDVSVPVYRIEHAFPVIAVVGIFHPRIFVAAKVLDSLNTTEFRAAIAHECGHLQASDNLKRTILRVCRDLLIIPVGKRLDQAWIENAEDLADEYATRSGRSAALDLAAALVKIARIIPANTSPTMPVGAFFIEERISDVTSRVRRLVDLGDNGTVSDRYLLFGISPDHLIWAGTLIALFFLPLVNDDAYAVTHQAIERLVHILG